MITTHGWANHDADDGDATVACWNGIHTLYGYRIGSEYQITVHERALDGAVGGDKVAAFFLTRSEAIFLRNALTSFIERPITVSPDKWATSER